MTRWLTDVLMRMCSSFLHEESEIIAKTRIREVFLRPCLKANILALAITIQPKHQVWTPFGLPAGVWWLSGCSTAAPLTFDTKEVNESTWIDAQWCFSRRPLSESVWASCQESVLYQLPIEWRTYSWCWNPAPIGLHKTLQIGGKSTYQLGAGFQTSKVSVSPTEKLSFISAWTNSSSTQKPKGFHSSIHRPELRVGLLLHCRSSKEGQRFHSIPIVVLRRKVNGIDMTSANTSQQPYGFLFFPVQVLSDRVTTTRVSQSHLRDHM